MKGEEKRSLTSTSMEQPSIAGYQDKLATKKIGIHTETKQPWLRVLAAGVGRLCGKPLISTDNIAVCEGDDAKSTVPLGWINDAFTMPSGFNQLSEPSRQRPVKSIQQKVPPSSAPLMLVLSELRISYHSDCYFLLAPYLAVSTLVTNSYHAILETKLQRRYQTKKVCMKGDPTCEGLFPDQTRQKKLHTVFQASKID